MLRFYEDAKDKMPEESMKWHKTSVMPPQKDKVYKWKKDMSKFDQWIFEKNAKNALEIFEYELREYPPNMAIRLKNLYYSVIYR